MHGTEKGFQSLRILKLSLIAIFSVVLVEFFLGLIVGSLAILSDSAHALLDAFSALVLFVAMRASLKPPDEEHMYGHEKIESIGGFIGGIVLIGVAAFLIIEAVPRLFGGQSYIVEEYEFAGFIAIGYTFCIDIFRVGIMHKAEKSESSTMKAGFYHALADMGSTIIAFLGFGLATLGFYYGDALASIVLSALITYLSVRLVWISGTELSDAVSKDVAAKVRRQILSKDICKCENLKVRKAGAKYFVEATILVPDYMSLEEAHSLVSQVESDIRKLLGTVEITFHIEPSKTEISTEKLVEKIATEIKGVKEAHEISVAYTDKKLYITLHAQVDPNLPIQEAHEIAEKIEKTINEKIKGAENVTVHIEPFNVQLRKGSMVDEGEIRSIVRKIAEEYKQTVRVRRIVTYVADEQRYINIDCRFSKETAIKEAHKIASKIERAVKKQFAETTVTVHVEPS